MDVDTRIDSLENELAVFKQGLLVTLRDLEKSICTPIRPNSGNNEPPDKPMCMDVEPRICDPGRTLPISKIQKIDTKSMNNEEAAQAPVIETPARTGTMVPLSTLTKLVEWAETTSSELGAERTTVFLDIAEMLGYVPAGIKTAIEKIIPVGGLQELVSPYSVRKQLNALKELAGLLEKRRTYDFIMLQIIAQGMPCFSWPDSAEPSTNN
jgi:hypothetical protein